MVKVLRIDDRLMHAQVTFGWANSLGVKGILIISDRVMNDPTMQTAAQFAKPARVKLWMKGLADGIAAVEKMNGFSYNTMIIVDNVKDALAVCERCDCVKFVNMGGQRMQEGRSPVLGTVFLSSEDWADLKKIEDLGVKVVVQKMITDPGYPLKHFL